VAENVRIADYRRNSTPGTGLEDPPHLAQGGRGIGDCAQRPGGQSGVKAAMGEWQRLVVQAEAMHRPKRRFETFVGQPPAEVRGLNRSDALNFRRVGGDVEPGADPDFDDISREALADPAAVRPTLCRKRH
jgi:hypothetical protein